MYDEMRLLYIYVLYEYHFELWHLHSYLYHFIILIIHTTSWCIEIYIIGITSSTSWWLCKG